MVQSNQFMQIYSTEKRGIDEKVYVYPWDMRNTTYQDDAYLHSAIVKTPEKDSTLASCVTISSTSNVDPGIVVNMIKQSIFLNKLCLSQHTQMAIGLNIPNHFTMVDIYAYNKNQESMNTK